MLAAMVGVKHDKLDRFYIMMPRELSYRLNKECDIMSSLNIRPTRLIFSGNDRVNKQMRYNI